MPAVPVTDAGGSGSAAQGIDEMSKETSSLYFRCAWPIRSASRPRLVRLNDLVVRSFPQLISCTERSDRLSVPRLEVCERRLDERQVALSGPTQVGYTVANYLEFFAPPDPDRASEEKGFELFPLVFYQTEKQAEVKISQQIA